MWSFATHAGAGMAIAGLTATYYALTRRNYQGERERMAHESGFGDGSQIRRLYKQDDDGQSLSQSQQLLRKELQELSVSNGSVSGLNVLYQQKNPIHPFTRSNFEITPIVSRVDTRPSEIYSENELSEGDISAHSIIDGCDDVGGGGDNESVFGSKPDLEKNGEESGSGRSTNGSSGSDQLSELEAVPISSESKSPTKSDEVNADDREDVSKQSTIQPIADTVTTTETNGEIVGQNNVSVKSSSEAKQIESETADSAKLNPVQETQLHQRTPSPICFFKNPGFGNRYSANMRKKKAELGPLVAATFSSSNINLSTATEEKKTTPSSSKKVGKNDSQDAPLLESTQLSSSSKTKDSTQFLLSPILSESNVSICDQDLSEKLVKKRKKRQPFSHSRTDANTKVVADANPMEEITKYNKTLKRSKVHTSPHAGKGESVMEEHVVRLRSDPANSNLCRHSKRSGKPVIPPSSSRPESSGDYAPPPKVDQKKVELTETLDIPEQADIHEKVEPPKKVESTKKRVTFKEIQVEEKQVKLEEEIMDQIDLDGNNNINSKETSVTEEDFFDKTSVSGGGGIWKEPFIISSENPSDCGRILSRPTSSSSIGNIPTDSWIAFPVRICTDLMRTVTIPWPLIGLCVLVVMIAGFLGIFLNRLAAVVDRKHREVQLD